LLDRSALDRGYVQEAEVRSILDAHEHGEGDRSAQIWALLALEHWQREVGEPAGAGYSPAAARIASR
jgi:hypothetical protein